MLAAAPFYIHPAEDPDAWRDLLAGRLGLAWAVVNVANGPGDRPDAHYYGPVLAHGSRTPLRGYIDLGYGRRAPEAVFADAMAWRAWYGIEALMLDQAPARASRAPDLPELLLSLRAAGFGGIALNPGTALEPAMDDFVTDADVVCQAEHDWDTYRSLPDDWPGGWHIVHSVPRGRLQDATRLARERGASHVWVTDAALPNPYSALPTGWAA